MKICFLSSKHPPEDKRVFDKQARSLAYKGFEVIHIAPGDFQSQKKDGVFLEVYPAPKGTKGRLLNLPSLFRIAKRVDADVYHCNEVDSWVMGILLKLFLGKKVVFDVHEVYPTMVPEYNLPKFLNPPSIFCLKALFRLLIPLTDYFVFAKRSVIRDFPGTANKSCVVLNASYLRLQERSRSDVDETIQRLYRDQITIVHLGLFSKARGWPQLLDSMAIMRHKEVNVSFIGTLYDGSNNQFNAKVRAMNLENRVRVIPWLPFDEAYDHVLCCQIGLCLLQPGLGHEYAYPHKIFDYMLAGLPIIVPEISYEVCEIVRQAECGLIVDTTSPKAIADALDRLVSDTGLARTLGENGRKAVIEKYNWEAEFGKLLVFYNS